MDVELEIIGVHLYVALGDLVEQMVEVRIAILTARVQITSNEERWRSYLVHLLNVRTYTYTRIVFILACSVYHRDPVSTTVHRIH